MIARISNNLTQWIKFFLVGVIETSKNSIQVFKDILLLKSDLENNRLPKLGNSIENGQQLIRHLFQNPIIDTKDVAEFLKVANSTANRLINKFVELNILSELTGYKRNRKFMFKEYVQIYQLNI